MTVPAILVLEACVANHTSFIKTHQFEFHPTLQDERGNSFILVAWSVTSGGVTYTREDMVLPKVMDLSEAFDVLRVLGKHFGPYHAMQALTLRFPQFYERAAIRAYRATQEQG